MRYRYRSEVELKETNSKWIGKIPFDWNITRIKNFTTVKSIRGREKAELLSLYRDYGVLPKSSRDDNFNRESEDLSNYKYVEKNNLVLNKMKVWQGSLAVSKYDGIVSPAYIICELNSEQVYPGFIHKLLRNKLYIPEYRRLSTGIRPNQWDMNYEDFKNIIAVIPNIKEQKKISDFLHEKTAQFDSIISKKEALIQKLEEAKKSLISEVVIGKVKVVKTSDGYELVERDRDEMKDSGVEWLGKIPKTWATTKLKLKTSQINRGKSPEYVESSNIKVINQACIYWDEFKLQNVKYQDENIKGERGKLYKGDILINSTGTGTLGRTNIFNEEGEFIVDSHVTIVRCLEGEYARYLNRVLRTDLYQRLIYSTMVTGSTNQIELSREGLRNMTILDLNIEELIKINEILDLKINDINNTIRKMYTQIEKLKEAKQSLISEAVTGKIEILD